MDNTQVFTKLVLPRTKIVELTLGAPHAQFFERMAVMHISMAMLNFAVHGKKSDSARTLSVRLASLVESWIMPPEVVLVKTDNPALYEQLQAMIVDTAADALDHIFDTLEGATSNETQRQDISGA